MSNAVLSRNDFLRQSNFNVSFRESAEAAVRMLW